jgi:hypothetical protein
MHHAARTAQQEKTDPIVRVFFPYLVQVRPGDYSPKTDFPKFVIVRGV